MDKPTLVTGWFRRHGMAYLDFVALALDKADLRGALARGEEVKAKTRLVERMDQHDLARELGYYGDAKVAKLEQLGRVVMLLPREPSSASDARPSELVEPGKWKKVSESVERTDSDAASLLEVLRAEISSTEKFPSAEWFDEHWPGRQRLAWHVILDAPLATQIAWYKRHSQFYLANQSRIELEEIDITEGELEDPEAVTTAMYRWLEKHGRGDRFLVNLWGTATAVQFGWYSLAWRCPALKNAVFLKCFDEKSVRGLRFKPVTIEVIRRDPIAKLSELTPARSWGSDTRRQARRKLEFFLRQNDNFSIMIVGERGTGKTVAVREAWETLKRKKKFVSANCADFRGDPALARSELFGYLPGAFTGAGTKRKIGLLERAKDGLLFLDEVHHLDRATMSMLLTALQTEKDGKFSVRPLGSNEPSKISFQPVFASNRPLEDLVGELPPDFWDRISQRFVVWPSLDDEEMRDGWNEVWERMDFRGTGLTNPVEDKEQDWFLPWLIRQPLKGNFRDLQRIAIMVADYQREKNCAEEDRWMETGLSLQDFLEREFPGRVRPPEDECCTAGDVGARSQVRRGKIIQIPFDFESPTADEKSYLAACRREFALAAQQLYGSAKKAVDELHKRGSKMNQSKMCRWESTRK